jgi:predicted membrane chloride channel (bestrophin family)
VPVQLVFRTNASYGRFLEARLLTGSLVLHTREFARLAVIHFPSMALRQRALAYISAFGWCLKVRASPEWQRRERSAQTHQGVFE